MYRYNVLVLSLAGLFIGSGRLYPNTHEMGVGFMLGFQPYYGQNYESANAPLGIKGLNSSTTSVPGTKFSDIYGISAELQLKYILFRKFYFGLGGVYSIGAKSSAKFPLRNPATQDIYTNGATPGVGSEVPVNASITLKHYGIPLNLGLVMNFWDELRVYMGPGISYMWAEQVFTMDTADLTIMDFASKSSLKSSFLVYHANLNAEYVLVGSPEDSNRLSLMAGFQIFQGNSGSVGDSSVETNLPSGAVANPFPLKARDAGSIQLSGYKFFIGVSYYFLKK